LGGRAAPALWRDSGGDEKPVAAVLVHEAGDQIDFLAGFQQGTEDRVIRCRAVSHRGGQVLQHVAGQRKLRENDQVGACATRFLYQRKMPLQVGLHISQLRINLR
jgi:hypothetical protein